MKKNKIKHKSQFIDKASYVDTFIEYDYFYPKEKADEITYDHESSIYPKEEFNLIKNQLVRSRNFFIKPRSIKYLYDKSYTIEKLKINNSLSGGSLVNKLYSYKNAFIKDYELIVTNFLLNLRRCIIVYIYMK